MKTLPTFHHTISGADGAPWLTFIPGIGNDASFWRRQVQAMSQRFRVLSFDPWGHGASPAPPEDCHFEDIVRGIVQMWNTLGIERSSVAGLGFGGSLAVALGIDHPQRIERIVAFCCRPRQPDDRRDFWRARREAALKSGMAPLVDATVDRWLRPEFRRAHPEVDDELRRMMRRTTVAGYCAYVGAFVEMDFCNRLEELNVPTLLVAAEHDHGGGPVEAMQDMAARIRGARLEVIKGAGHICNHEAPEAVEAILAGFLTTAQAQCA